MATKVSVYLDERTIERLRQRAVRQRGTMRSLSKEIEDLVTESFVLDELEAALAEDGESERTAIGFRDVRPLEVSPGTSVTRMIREEREHRHEVSPRRKRRP
jgi:hypothetical protein